MIALTTLIRGAFVLIFHQDRSNRARRRPVTSLGRAPGYGDVSKGFWLLPVFLFLFVLPARGG